MPVDTTTQIGLWTLGTGLLIWILTRGSSNRDERRKAKIRFTSFLVGWEGEITGTYQRSIVANQFSDRRKEFIIEAELMKPHIRWPWRRYIFDINAQCVTCLTPGYIENEKGQKALLKGIRTMIEFVS